MLKHLIRTFISPFLFTSWRLPLCFTSFVESTSHYKTVVLTPLSLSLFLINFGFVRVGLVNPSPHEPIPWMFSRSPWTAWRVLKSANSSKLVRENWMGCGSWGPGWPALVYLFCQLLQCKTQTDFMCFFYYCHRLLCSASSELPH